MPVLAVTANVLISFALYFGIVALLYGGTDVAASMSSGEQQTKPRRRLVGEKERVGKLIVSMGFFSG